MPVKIRLQRKGRKKQPFYHIVIADSRAPRDGRFIEKIGTYNPITKPATIDLDRDKAFDWLMKGAQPTETVRAMLRFKGVLYRKHLMRGVKKGALTIEEANAKYQDWIDNKEAKIAVRFEEEAAKKAAFRAEIAGTPAPKKPETAEEGQEIPAVEVESAAADDPEVAAMEAKSEEE